MIMVVIASVTQETVNHDNRELHAELDRLCAEIRSLAEPATLMS